MKKNASIFYSVAGVAIMLVILVVFNALTGAVNQRVDLTQEKAYTLSAGTRAILKKLDTPVKIRFYTTSGSENFGDVVTLKNYAQEVADLLAEYKQEAGGKLMVESYDPKPGSDAEDSARLDSVEGQMLPNGEKFYLGMAISQGGESRETLPFLNPSRERLLEYDISRAISRVVKPSKPLVGILSALPVFGKPGNPMMMNMGQSSSQQPPWELVSELKADFEVREVPLTASKIDDDLKVLIVIHPKEITDATQFAIDQFILRGGKLIAYLDTTSLLDSRSENPMMGQLPGGGSSLDRLLKAWGIQFDTTKTVADLNYKVQMGGRNNQPIEAPAFLDLTEDAINRDDLATSEVRDIWYPLGGVFTGTPVAGLKETVLLKTTKDSQLVEGEKASFSGETILKEFKPSGIEYALAIRLTGQFKTAFLDGKPKESKDETKPEEKATNAMASAWLKESKGENMVVLFGDADMLGDQYSLRQLGSAVMPVNGNLALAENLVDQMAGDNDLISVRSRAAMDRPFTRIVAMKTKAEESFQSKIADFDRNLQETQEKVNELQSQKQDAQQKFILSPEQQTELENLKKKQASLNIELKKEQKNLNHEIYAMENTIKWGNIIGMPALVAFSGIGLALFKRKRTSAK